MVVLCSFKPEINVHHFFFNRTYHQNYCRPAIQDQPFFLVACNEIIRLHFQLHISFLFRKKKGNAQSYYVFPTDFLSSSYKNLYRPWKYEIKCFISCSLFRPFFVGNPQINSGKCIPCMEFCNGNTGLCFPIDLFNSSLNLSSKSRRSGYDDSTQSRWPHYSVADEELERFKGRVSNICMLSKSQGTWKGHKTKFILLVKSSEITLIILPAFYLIMWLMK